MLHTMRKGAGGWLAKGLLLLLVGSFAIWGIGGSMLNSSVGSDVIKVGSQQVSIGEFQREYRNRLGQVSQYLGRQLSADEARQYGITQSTILGIQTRLLEKERAKELSLGISDDFVAREIRYGDLFKDEKGEFDRMRFLNVLNQNRFSEAEYVALLRDEMIRKQLTQSLAIPTSAPNIVVDRLFAYQLEKRSAQYVELLDADAGQAPAPTDEQLTKFIKDNATSFTAPEYRKAKFLFLTPEKFTKDVTVTDKEIQQEYDERISEFQAPEYRSYLQIIFPDEKTAQEAIARLTGGADFATVAKEMKKLSPSDIDVGPVARSTIVDELQEPIFSAQQGEIVGPTNTGLGWHIVQVTKIEPANAQTVDDVRKQLSDDIALRKAADILYNKSAALQDEFAGGASIEEAAATIGLSVEQLDWVDNLGRKEDGKVATNIPPIPEFMGQLFSTTTDADIDLVEVANGNYMAIALTDIKPSVLKSLASVRGQATAAWQANWRHEENKKKADTLLEKLKGGVALSSIAGDVKVSAPGNRGGAIAGLSREAVSELFKLDKNEFAQSSNAKGDGFILLTLKEVIPADKVKDKEIYDRVKATLTDSYQQDIAQQYQVYLEKKIGVSVKENLIKEYF